MEALHDLERFLVSAFSSSELRRFLAYNLPEGVHHFLPEGLSLADYVYETTRALQRHGLLDAELFGRLASERRARASEVTRVQSRHQAETELRRFRLRPEEADPLMEIREALDAWFSPRELRRFASDVPGPPLPDVAGAGGPFVDRVLEVWRAEQTIGAPLFAALRVARPRWAEDIERLEEVWRWRTNAERAAARQRLAADLDAVMRRLLPHREALRVPTSSLVEPGEDEASRARTFAVLEHLRRHGMVAWTFPEGSDHPDLRMMAAVRAVLARRNLGGDDGAWLQPLLPVSATRVFVSYASRARDLATSVAEELENLGYTCFLDFDRIAVAKPWRDQLLRQLRECDCFVGLATDGYWSSDWCSQEIGAAIAMEKVCIVLTEEGAPPRGFAGAIQAMPIGEPGTLPARLASFLAEQETARTGRPPKSVPMALSTKSKT